MFEGANERNKQWSAKHYTETKRLNNTSSTKIRRWTQVFWRWTEVFCRWTQVLLRWTEVFCRWTQVLWRWTHVHSGVLEWLSSHCSTCEAFHFALVTNMLISHQWGTDRMLITTNGTYPGSFLAQILHNS
jgi:hypothetical protein